MLLLNRPKRLSKAQRSRIARRAARRAAVTRRHQKALTLGDAARKAITSFACSKHPYRAVRRIRAKGCGHRPLGTLTHGLRMASPFSYGATRRNPAAILGALGTEKTRSAFSDGIQIALGALLHQQISPRIAAGVGWTDGWKKLVIDLGTSGLELLVPKFGSRLFMGGLVRVLVINGLPLIEKFTTTQLKDIQDYEMGDDLGHSYTEDLGRGYVDEGLGRSYVDEGLSATTA